MQYVRVREDKDGSHTWHRIEETFEQTDGQDRLVSRLTFNDDGTVEQDTYVDDIVRHRVIANNEKLPLGCQIDPWDQVEYRYDAEGAQQQVTTFYLSGKIRDQWQASAVPPEKSAKLSPTPLDGDDASWKSVTVTYDADSLVLQRDFVFEDGSARAENYDRGTLTEILQESAPGQGWVSVLTTFGPDGLIARRLTLTDDGQETEEAFEDGEPIRDAPHPEDVEDPVVIEVRSGADRMSESAEVQLGDTSLQLTAAFQPTGDAEAPADHAPVPEDETYPDASDSFIFSAGG